MRISSSWIARSCLATVCAVGCVATSARLREALIGVPGLELRQCIGAPLEVIEQGDTEIARYRWAEQVEARSIFGAAERVETYDRDRQRIQDRVRDWPVDGRSEEDRKRLGRRGRLGFCELRFALQGGKVRSVEAEGRSSQGVNLDAECLLRARDCVPREKLFR